MVFLPATRAGQSLRRRIPVAAGGDFVNDTFTDSNNTLLENHTGETGATWTKHGSFGSGSLWIQSNRIDVAVDVTNACYYASGLPPSADYEVLTQVYVSSVNDFRGPAFRVQTGADTMYTALFDGDNVVRMYKRVAGSQTQIGISAALGWGVGELHAINLYGVGTTISVDCDSVNVISVTDSDIAAAGRAGVYMYGSAGQGVMITQLRGLT